MIARLRLVLFPFVLILGSFGLSAQDTLVCTSLDETAERVFIVTGEHELILKSVAGKRTRVIIEEFTDASLTVRPKFRTRAERKARRLAERSIHRDTTMTPAELRETVEFLGRPTTRQISLNDVEMLVTLNKYRPEMRSRLKFLTISNTVWLWAGVPGLFLFATPAYAIAWAATGATIITSYLLTERKQIKLAEWKLGPVVED